MNERDEGVSFGTDEHHYRGVYGRQGSLFDETGNDFRENYADAHYEPIEESTVPPRYYTPPVRTARTKRNHSNQEGKFFQTVLAVLVLLVLVGTLMTVMQLSRRIRTLEAALQEKASEEALAEEILPETADTGFGETELIFTPAEIYEKAIQQVVGIRSEFTMTNFFGMSSSGAVSGTGFIVNPDGYILTNYHVVEDAYKRHLSIDVMTYDGEKYEAAIVGVEPGNDIAVLKIEAEGLSAAVIGNSNTLNVGDTIYAIGNPLGELEFSMSTGHVSALGRVISTDEGESINMFQIDAAVNEGNSGGPLYNERGEVVGIVTAKYSSSGVEGLGFAIPSNDANEIAMDLITKGYVSGKAALGVTINNEYTAMYAQYYGMPLGAYVEAVTAGGAAETAGMQPRDIILWIDDTLIQNYSDLRQCLRRYHATDEAVVTVYRNGEELKLTVTFDEAKPS